MKFVRLWGIAAIVFTVAMLSVSAKADPIIFTATLTGSQENPPTNSTARGFGTIVLNGNQATISLSFTGITSGATAAHIHQPTVLGGNGPVTIPFDGLFAVGANSASFTTVVTLTASQITALNAGLLYFNVHSPSFPSGEIRGNISAVPEPATLMLLGTGLLSLAGIIKRRKKNSE
ncbi:MAG: CHRD domain-containing protein [Blastocatellia bacterium]